MLKVGFICVHNSARSQMAEGFGKKYGEGLFESFSAGTEEYERVKPLAVKVMEEKGVDMSEHRPKLLSEIPSELDILITMGCNVVCPFVPCKHSEDWGIEDPSGGNDDDFRRARDIIEMKVKDLVTRINQKVIKLD